jgi:acetyl esterase/lipase
MDSTRHAHHPAYATALGPAAEMFASMPKHPVGDVNGRRAYLAQKFGASSREHAELPAEVYEKVHQVRSKDGTLVKVYQLALRRHDSHTGPAVLYMHGGGYFLGSVVASRKSYAEKMLETGVPYFVVDYRLSPEHPYPAPLEDCYAALSFMRDNAATIGVDPSRIGLVGESSGGGLAAGLALLARDKNFTPPIKHQILIYPMLDDRNVVPDPAIEDLTIWKAADNETGWGAYLGHQKGPPDGYAVPARADDLTCLPSVYMDVGTLDIFRDENISYVSRLVKAGVPVEFHLLPGLPHAWEMFKPDAPGMKDVLAARLRAIGSL